MIYSFCVGTAKIASNAFDVACFGDKSQLNRIFVGQAVYIPCRRHKYTSSGYIVSIGFGVCKGEMQKTQTNDCISVHTKNRRKEKDEERRTTGRERKRKMTVKQCKCDKPLQ